MVRIAFLSLFFIYLWVCKISGEDMRLYVATERPVLTHVNPKFFSFLNFTSKRFGRRNPLYYVDIHFTSLISLDNNVTVEFSFYEYISLQFHRSFLEISLKWCNLIYKDALFGPAMRKNLPKSCPHKPGEYHLRNMTLSIGGMPNFPFTRGRIYANLTWKHDQIGSGYIDMELKRKKLQSSS